MNPAMSPARAETAALDARVGVARAEFAVELDLALAPGETVALMGPSGAGKTTVLDALAGLTRLDAGRIVLGGETLADAAHRVHLPPSRRRVGRLGQDAELFPHLTVRDNIAFAISARGGGREQARSEAREWLERIGLSGLQDRRPAALSGGQAKRVALVRALAARPRLLLVDEPFASLDVEVAADMRELIAAQLREHPTTTILVSHDARDALALADRMVVIQSGRAVQQGSVETVLAQPRTRFVEALATSVGG